MATITLCNPRIELNFGGAAVTGHQVLRGAIAREDVDPAVSPK